MIEEPPSKSATVGGRSEALEASWTGVDRDLPLSITNKATRQNTGRKDHNLLIPCRKYHIRNTLFSWCYRPEKIHSNTRSIYNIYKNNVHKVPQQLKDFVITILAARTVVTS